MFQTSFQEIDAFLNRRMRVLLSLSTPRDSRLLADQLRDTGLDVVVPDDDASLPHFDLCVADTNRYRELEAAVESRRAELGAVHLPVLLVLGPKEPPAAAGHFGDRIDDVVTVPTSGEEFQHRVDALLRTKRQSEQLALFARAMDAATAGITIAEADGDQLLRYANDAFLEITGYDREEVLGRNCRFLQGEATSPEPVRRIRTALDRELPVSVELRNYRKDGTMFWNHLEIAPVYGESGVSHFVGFQQDVTERVESKRALERYERIVQAAGDPIYALDSDLRFTLLNEATTELSQLDESAIRGSYVATVFGDDHADVLEAAAQDLSDNLASERTVGTVVQDTTGRARRFQTTVAALPAADSEGIVCVSRDITEDQEREARLSVLDRVLRHNLRNKLMVMLARTEQIQQRTGDQRVDESAAAIEQASEELLDLAETARKFKRTLDPTAGEGVTPTDIAKQTHRAVAETRLEFEDATFVVSVPESLWAMVHDAFELAMTELLERGAKAGVHVEVTVEMTIEDGTAVVRVSHDGEGLTEVEMAALNDGTESELQHTTGLGLWFVRWMAINSGGSFHIAADDPGTLVELTLPLADTPPGTTTRG